MSSDKVEAPSSSSSKEEKQKDEENTPGTDNKEKPVSSQNDALSMETLRKYLADKLGISKGDGGEDDADGEKQEPVIKELNFDCLMEHWNEKGFKNIITMVGAGISTSAGIPDFRSPETGLYHNLQKYNLPYPTAIFELTYFKKNPKPFFSLAKELYPGTFKPTPCHYFIKMLENKGILLRNYSQNIDTLERIAGVSGDKLVEAHGTFFTNHCTRCQKSYSMKWVKEEIFKDNIPTCKCEGIVKPDIVFFGENLPERFYELPEEDFDKCDLLIIMGTSLEVQPFASLINRVPKNCLRLLINRELVGNSSWYEEGLCLNKKNNVRDISWIGNCDDGVQEIANRLGFGDELRELIKSEHKKIDEENKSD